MGLASYRVDSHSLHRFVRDGVLMTDGYLHDNYPRPYPISYRSIVPKAGECENLSVSFALSASHVAFTSIRMEPVFMILSQSASTASSLAIDANLTLQAVPYDKLRGRLLADGQLFEATGPKLTGSNLQQLTGILVDDEETQKTGPWVPPGRSDFRVGTGYIHDANAHKGEVSLTITPRIPTAGEYELFLVFSPHANRAMNVPVSIAVGDQPTKNITVNRQNSYTGGVVSLGKFQMPQGTGASVTISNLGTDSHVSVDGLQVVPLT